MKVELSQPVICICHVVSLPGNPVMVRLHHKKDFRELDAGKLHIRAKIAQADAADVIPAQQPALDEHRSGDGNREKQPAIRS